MNVIIDIFQFHFKSEQKQVNEIKSNGTCSNLTLFFLIYKVVTFEIYFLIRFI